MSGYTSSDGLMSSSDPNAVALWEDIAARRESQKMSWTEILRAMGVKYAHPDDGWVTRERGKHSRSWYPQFDDRPEVGDLIAFGCAPDSEHYRSWFDVYNQRRFRKSRGRDRKTYEHYRDGAEVACNGYRICRVTAVERSSGRLGYHQDFEYEDTGQRVPPRAPKWYRRKRATS